MVEGGKSPTEGDWIDLIRSHESTLLNRTWELVAPAKLNLRLFVEGRRGDGYHLLSMLNVSTTLVDTISLSLSASTDCEVKVSCAHQDLQIATEHNLLTAAFVEFWRAFGCQRPPMGLRARINKKIPVGAGLGGGSSDAGALLRFLAAELGPQIRDLCGVSHEQFRRAMLLAATRVGADVPYAYHGGCAWVGGIGDDVQPLRIKAPWPFEVLIIVPPQAVPTVEFYSFFRQQLPSIVACRDDQARDLVSGGELVFSLDLLRNDFETQVCRFVPVVGEALRMAREFFPQSTSLTGSGSAIFSLVQSDQAYRIAECRARLEGAGMAVHRVQFQ